MKTSSFQAILFAGVLAVQSLLVTWACAQTESTGLAVVKEDGTVLRAGDMPRFYRVMDLNAGTVVVTLGTSDGWTKVAYPAGARAYVEADRVEKVDDMTLRLTKPSNLLAPSALLGASGSWCPLFAEPLPVNTTLKLVEEVAGIGGKVSKYLVVAPTPPAVEVPPAGFVRADALRAATADEIARFKGNSAKPDTPAPEPTEDEIQPESSDSQPAQHESSDISDVDTSLLEPIVSGPLDETGEDVASQPEAGEPETSEPTLATDGGGAAPAEVSDPEHLDMVVLSINQLNRAFDELREMPRAEADQALEELLAECRRTADKLSDEPELVHAIGQRIAWLNLRIKLRDQRRALERAIREAEQSQAELARRVGEWKQGRSFTVVGRVYKSTLYDGERLPLMYRIESVEGPGLGRTSAYIKPGENQDFSGLVGAIVGVVGRASLDDALGVRIITAESIQKLDQ